MSKNAVIVTNVDFDHIYQYTKPSIKKYSENVGAELVTLTQKSLNIQGDGEYEYLRFENLQVYNYFDSFDRILLLDCDVIIKPDCPNYFSLDENFIYVTRQDNNPKRQKSCQENLIKIQKDLGVIHGWDKFYFNSGVMLLSKQHKELFNFDTSLIKKVTGTRKIQNYLNWKAQKLGFKLYDLGYNFNFIDHFIKAYSTPKIKQLNDSGRSQANILHYTGKKHKGSRVFKLIEQDSLFFKEKTLY